jgi:hypothetical protein
MMSRRSHSPGSGLPATRPRPTRPAGRRRRLVPSTPGLTHCLNRRRRVRTRRSWHPLALKSLFTPHTVSTCRRRVLIRTIRPTPRCLEDPPARRRTTTGWLGSTREANSSSNSNLRRLSPRSRIDRPQHWQRSRHTLHIPLGNPIPPPLFPTLPLHLRPLRRPRLRHSVPRIQDRCTDSRHPHTRSQRLVARAIWAHRIRFSDPQLNPPRHATTPSRMAHDRGRRRPFNPKQVCLALGLGRPRQPCLPQRHRVICRLTRPISSMCRPWSTEPISSSHIAVRWG